MRAAIWRVRVKRAIESWVEVQAASAAEAEREAAKVPGVVSVFARSAATGDEIVQEGQPLGVRDE
jgi:hypothetical protein